MNIGPISLPIGLVFFLLSIAAAIFAGYLSGKKNKEIEPAIFTSTIIGLIVARISFVLHYLPSFDGSLLKMVDFRDAGFDMFPGVAAGIVVIVFILIRRRNIRRPLLISTVVGLATWGVTSTATTYFSRSAAVPTLSLFNEAGTAQALPPRDGKPLVINLWATWCAPCQAEMPVLASAQARYPGLDLVFVNQAERHDTVDAFMKALNLHIANSLFDPELSVAKATDTNAYPTTLFYDTSGRLVERHLGRFSQATFEEAISRLYPASVLRSSQ
ncbi:TlpA family protein disulfide reductase [Trinickia mobilis]|uniref:TlpA family protein disulfide reductase n=1 Tax=Trinickia mobilis TaxID=2816356 RepID=UPI001A8E0501|nr:TlpA disulfide reductase family protein [Trinickia mobilis]